MTRELQALVENMEDAVNVRALDGHIVLANAASAAMLGAGEPGELPGTPLPELWDRFSLFDADGAALHDEDLPWYRLLRGAAHVEPLLMRRVTRETGEQQWLLNKATPIRDQAGGSSW
jgi:PAS domain-containing protein